MFGRRNMANIKNYDIQATILKAQFIHLKTKYFLKLLKWITGLSISFKNTTIYVELSLKGDGFVDNLKANMAGILLTFDLLKLQCIMVFSGGACFR